MPSGSDIERALALQRDGKLDAAFAVCESLLASNPRDAEALHLSGVLLYQGGRVAQAIERLRAAVAAQPTLADAWSNLGLALDAAGRRTEAVQALNQALKNAPQVAEYASNIAAVELAAGRWAHAESAARQALAIDGSSASAWHNLALALQTGGRLLQALEASRRANGLAPQAVAYAGLRAELEDAIGAPDAARQTLEAALARNPLSSALRFQFADLLERAGKPADALEAYEQVLRLDPSHGAALSQAIFLRRRIVAWDGLAEAEARFRARAGAGRDALLSPFMLLSQPSTRAEQRRAADAWARTLIGAPVPTRRRRLSRDRLRIGYLSSDFHTHATAVLAAGLFECHDRSRVEVVGYSTGRDDESPMRRRLVAAFDRFVDARHWPLARVADAIRQDGVDVLVDLKGHTAGAPLPVLAMRPAPIQVHYLGYPGTIGGGLVDYLIGDRVVTPREHAGDYAETLVRLPHCYQVNDRVRPITPAPTRAELGLPDDAVVLCCFNQPWKVNPSVLDAWTAILREAPEALLWLLARDPDDPAIRNLRREAQARGVDPARVRFATHGPNPDYLARYRVADLFVDTWPYNAHTTASDALWAGCPVLTTLGETFAGRVAASLLVTVGLPDLIARDPADYVRRAVALVRDPAARARLRAHLDGPGRASPLFDTDATARALEAAYEAMAGQYRNLARAPIDL